MYVSLTSLGAGDNQPLLDSRFPDVGGKGRGYILNSTPDGTEQWPALRKVSIWQTATALQRVRTYTLHNIAQHVSIRMFNSFLRIYEYGVCVFDAILCRNLWLDLAALEPE